MTSRCWAGTALAACFIAVAAGTVRADGSSGTAGAARSETAAVTTPPATDGDLIAKVRAAFANHDLDFFEQHLVEWEGARKRTRRLTLFQIRECFGRSIKSARLEPLKPDPAAPLVPDGYRTNLPVTHLLRVVFDEQHASDETPSCVFMLSKVPKASYRMVLVLPTAPPPK